MRGFDPGEAIMKKLVVGMTMLLAMTAGASARDLELELPAYEAAHTWRGFYVGGYVAVAQGGNVTSSVPCVANTGGVFVQGSCYQETGGGFSTPGTPGVVLYAPASYSLGSGTIAGITGGYNYQLGKYVLGVESEAGYIHMSGSRPYSAAPFAAGAPTGCPGDPLCPNFNAASAFGNWYSAWTARAGVAGNLVFPSWDDGERALLYAKIGPAVGRFSTSATSVNTPTTTGSYQFFTSGTDTVWGVAAGAGFEWALNKNWSLKGEYEYLGFQHSTTACGTLLTGIAGGSAPVAPATTVCGSAGVPSVQTLKVGVNFSFR
jgi:outer membrane immunogenic protein